MPRTYQFIIAILLTVSAIALAWGIYSGSQPAEEPAAPAADAVVIESDELDQTAPIEPPPPLTDFSEMVARPLFSQTRSPEDPAAAAASPLPEQPTGKSRLLVMGIIITDQEKIALLKQNKPGNGDTLKVTEGQEVSGWKVASITPESVTVSQRETTDVIKLSDNVLSDADKRRLAALANASKASQRKSAQEKKKTPSAAKTRDKKRQAAARRKARTQSTAARRQTTQK